VPEPGAIAVLGAGSWGTALAALLARRGQRVRLWGRDARAVERMALSRRNERYLPGVELPSGLTPCADLGAAIESAADLLIAVPSHAFAETVAALAARVARRTPVAWATKGFEPGSARFLDAIVTDRLGANTPRAVLSGPTFAAEVARGLPTAVTVAGSDAHYTRHLAERFHGEDFRVYTSADLVGVQVGGAVKNVLAIAAGIADGLGFGANSRAALVTRGLAEVTRLGVSLGGDRETFTGLAGLGDLVLTCTDDQSRNRRFGLAIGGGAAVAAAEAGVGQVVEGLRNTREAALLARRAGVEMPIVEQVRQVLFEGLPADAAVRSLLSRRIRSEGG
jgi:glycerol-3-phosphate dehydrogenase (NAD(P)+)